MGFHYILNPPRRVGCFALLSFLCLITVNFLWFFLTVSWVGLQFVIVVFPDQTHLHFSDLINTTDEVFSENREDRKSCFLRPCEEDDSGDKFS